MPPTSLLLAGTKKGLFILTSEGRQKWNLHGPFHRGKEINHAVYDPRSHRVYATANDSWFGSGIAWSNDLGKTWVTPQNGPKFDPSSGLKLDRIWHIEPGRAEEPDVLYAGVAPAALFRSADGGQNWTEVTGLTSHPSRERWQPGYGGLCLHSIILDPKRPQRMFVGISAVGVFRTDNDGKDWAPLNKGTRAEFLPEKYPEFGQCVHKLLMASGDSSLLFSRTIVVCTGARTRERAGRRLLQDCLQISGSLWHSTQESPKQRTSFHCRAPNSGVLRRAS